MALNVLFLKGTQAAYEALGTKNENAFYLTESNVYLGSKQLTSTSELASAVARIAANEGNISTLQTEVGTIGSLTTTAKTDLVSAINELKTAIESEASTARLAEKANADAITTLNADENTAGSVAKSIKDAINDFATKISDDGTINTFKELIDYAAKSGSDIADLIAKVGVNETAITALKTFVGTLPEDSTSETIIAYIAEAIKVEETRATGVEGTLDLRLQAVEAKFDDGEGSVSDQISKAIANLDATVSQTAGTDGVSATIVETDGKLTSVSVSIAENTYDTYGAAAEAETNAKSYADGLADNYDAKGSATTAETNAKNYTDASLTWAQF